MNLDPRIRAAFEAENGFPITSVNLVAVLRVGSHSHGTFVPKEDRSLDDVDYMLVLFPPVETYLALDQWTHWTWKQDELDVVAYSFPKFVNLLVQSNPNVVGTLWLSEEDVVYASPKWRLLQSIREYFMSQRLTRAIHGWASSEIDRITANTAYKGYMGKERKALHASLGYDPKNLSHMVRLFRMGIECHTTGALQVRRPDAEELIRIKTGEFFGAGPEALERISETLAQLKQRYDTAKSSTVLQPEPNRTLISSYIAGLTFDYIVEAYT